MRRRVPREPVSVSLRATVAVLVGVAILLGSAGAGQAEGLRNEFRRGTVVVTPQVGGGNAHNIERFREFSDVSFVNAAIRVSLLPLDPIGTGLLSGALEVGVEPFIQYFTDRRATAEGLKAAARYHFLAAPVVVPYVEGLAGVAASSLNVREIDSDHAFFLEAGVGVSWFVTGRVALTIGYRFQHISNAGTDDPNRGINSSMGVMGLSFFFH